jgi:hypothetical protein
VKPKTTIFGLFRCFEPISKQLKQTDLFRNKPKQTETTHKFFEKYPNIQGGSDKSGIFVFLLLNNTTHSGKSSYFNEVKTNL